jgi:hypothetical protein
MPKEIPDWLQPFPRLGDIFAKAEHTFSTYGMETRFFQNGLAHASSMRLKVESRFFASLKHP